MNSCVSNSASMIFNSGIPTVHLLQHPFDSARAAATGHLNIELVSVLRHCVCLLREIAKELRCCESGTTIAVIDCAVAMISLAGRFRGRSQKL